MYEKKRVKKKKKKWNVSKTLKIIDKPLKNMKTENEIYKKRK